MSDPKPDPATPAGRARVSGKVSPPAVIVVVILIGIVAMVFVRQRGHHVTPSGVSAPMAASGDAVMPRQPADTTTLQPRANTNDAREAGPGTGNTGQ